ncbi:MAG: hypothetical protein AAFV28_13235 [Cyanobacteria bacterium J06635_13]
MPSGLVQGLVLGADDIEADYQELTQRGIELTPIYRGNRNRTIFRGC